MSFRNTESVGFKDTEPTYKCGGCGAVLCDDDFKIADLHPVTHDPQTCPKCKSTKLQQI